VWFIPPRQNKFFCGVPFLVRCGDFFAVTDRYFRFFFFNPLGFQFVWPWKKKSLKGKKKGIFPLWTLFLLLLLLLLGVGNSAMNLGSALARVMSTAATAAATRSSVGRCCSVGSLLSWIHDKYIPFASVPTFLPSFLPLSAAQHSTDHHLTSSSSSSSSLNSITESTNKKPAAATCTTQCLQRSKGGEEEEEKEEFLNFLPYSSPLLSGQVIFPLPHCLLHCIFSSLNFNHLYQYNGAVARQSRWANSL